MTRTVGDILDELDANPRAVIGGNMPPDPTPFEAFTAHINDLFETAQGFLDGVPVSSEAEADAVKRLLDESRKARLDADAARKLEAKPFDDGKAEVQARWTPLTDEKKGKCALIADACKQALKPWIDKLEEDRQAKAKAEREEADRLAQAAREARAAADHADLTERAKVEELTAAAEKAAAAAKRTGSATVGVKGDGRAASLRSRWVAELTDPAQYLRTVRERWPDELKAWLADHAQRQVSAGSRALPGITITETKTVV